LAGERGNGQLPKTASVNWWFPALDDAISFPIIGCETKFFEWSFWAGYLG